jgi:uncharacterized peroxidase-related enzyme
MPWTPWITIVPNDTTDETVRRLYDDTRERLTGNPPDAMRLTSLTPGVAREMDGLLHAIEHSADGLTAKEKEIAALIVAVLNGCVHWTASHLAALGRAARDQKFADQVKEDYTKANLSPRERQIAEFAVKVTRVPNACSPADLDALRAQGLADRDLLSLVEIVAYYNFSTRLFESLSTVNP